MNATPTNSQDFPQFFQANVTTKLTPISKSQMEDYRIHPAVQNRPNEIVAIEKEEHGIVLTLSTSGRRAVLCYTHETA